MGYRGNLPSIDKQNDEIRIFIVGGSSVFNGQPPIAELIENEFRKYSHENINVYNWGVVSSVSGMELTRIIFEISDFHPDLIILYNGANDMTHPLYWDPRPGYPFNFIVYENNVLLNFDKETDISFFAYKSNLLRMLFRKYFRNKLVDLYQARQEVNYNTEMWQNEIAEIYVTNIQKANLVSHSVGSELIVFFQPMIFFKDPLHELEEKIIDSLSYKHHLIIREKIFNLIEKTNSDENIQFFDLSDFYDNYPNQIFTDIVHTNQTAKEAISKQIYTYLKNNIQSKK